MAGRSGSSFNKLQKERARREKQLEKQARRRQRKLDKQAPEAGQENSEEHSGEQLCDDGPPIDSLP